MVKLALEPEWEARFEPNSYGFRPGRSVHDAIEAIFLSIKSKPKYVLDADIEKCFDKISHEKLLTKLNTIPSLRRLIRAWLKAGALEDDVFNQTEQGTPQGGVISPLLANIALHGMEQIVKEKFPVRGGPILIRYADDFLVFHKDLAVINHCKTAIELWLADIDLNLKEEKTRIAHTLLQDEHGNRGFDFLGMHIGQYNVGKTHTGKSNYGKPLGFKTFIRPSKKSQKKQHKAIQNIVRRNRTIEQERLIEQLNPVIRGWSKFHSTVVSKRVFSNMSHKLFQSLRRWANRRHPDKTQTWVNRKYWRLETGRWTFAARKGKPLRLYSETPIIRHVKVKENRSLYDGDWSYWGARLGRYPTLSNRKAMLLRKQKGRCSICKLQFTLGDDMDTDHIIPLHLAGKDIWANVQLLHAHCHVTKTRKDSLLHIND